MTTPVLELRSVHRTYETGEGELPVLTGADLALAPGELVGLVGPSGSGKSTLLHTAGLLERPDEGGVYLDGEDCLALSDNDRTRRRREKLGFVYQFHHLLPEFNALDNVAMPLFIDGTKKKIARERAAELLADMGLSERLHHQPGQLSGGEQQRVAIARAIAKQPDVLLCDEPTGALDYQTGVLVLEVIRRVNEELGTTTAVITHNVPVASMADRIVALADGHVTRNEVNARKVSPSELSW